MEAQKQPLIDIGVVEIQKRYSPTGVQFISYPSLQVQQDIGFLLQKIRKNEEVFVKFNNALRMFEEACKKLMLREVKAVQLLREVLKEIKHTCKENPPTGDCAFCKIEVFINKWQEPT